MPYLRTSDAELLLLPYTGLNFRKLLNLKTSTQGSYTSEANYTTLPLGVVTTFNIDKNSTIGLYLRYEDLLSANTKNNLSEVDNSYNDIKNTQKIGNGIFAKLEYTKHFTNNILHISTYYRKWKCEESETKMFEDLGNGYGRAALKPKNSTEMTGLNMAVSF